MTVRRLAVFLVLGAVPTVALPDERPAVRSAVPPGAAAFATFRFGDFYRSPDGQAALKHLRESAAHVVPGLERMVGVPLERIETVTAVLPAPSATPVADSVALVFDLNAPIKPADLVKALQEAEFERKGLPPGVHPLREWSDGSFTVAGDRRLIVFTTEQARREYADLWLRRDDPGPLAAALAAAEKGSLYALAARPAGPTENLAYLVPFGSSPVRPLTEARGIEVRADLGPPLRFEFRLTFADPGDAGRAEKALGALRGLLLLNYGFQADEHRRRGDRLGLESVEALAAAARAATVERNGATLVVKTTLAGAAPAAVWVRDRVRKPTTPGPNYVIEHLKQLGLALHNSHDTYGHLPPAAICDAAGKPLLSWRVAILPYIEHDNLYKQFRLNEPWDSEHNKRLLARMPETYRITPPKPDEPAGALPPDGVPEKYRTPFRVYVGGGAAFDLRKGARITDFRDGTSNTILVGVAAETVPWTKPDELTYDPKKPVPPLRRGAKEGPLVLLGDGSVQRLPATLKPATLRKLIMRDDGQVINLDE